MGTTEHLTETSSNAEAIINAVERLSKPDVRKGERIGRGSEVAYAFVPEGMRLESLKRIHDEFATSPERISGTAQLLDERSFIEHVNTFRTPPTTIFANPDFSNPSLAAVYDYHDNGKPDWAGHRAHWALKLSTEWRAWHAQASKAMSHAEFAEFLERHVPDVYWGDERSDYTNLLISQLELRLASPSQLIALSRNLAVNVDTAVKSAQTLSSGEISLQYVEQHRDGEGQPIKVANAFLIAIPVVPNGPLYQVLVRLRYRINNGKIAWFFDLHRVDLVFEAAFKEICERVTTTTDVPVLLGSPEK